MKITFRKVEKVEVDFRATYTYKGNRYKPLMFEWINIGSEWKKMVKYQCLYPNPKGTIWYRFEEDFVKLFKKEQ